MRRSAGIATCSPIWCGGCWRTAPTRRSCRSRPIRRCRSPTILRRPQDWIADAGHARHPRIPLPRDLYGPERKNSAGVEFGDRASLEALLDRACAAPRRCRQAKRRQAVARWRVAAVTADEALRRPWTMRRRSRDARRAALRARSARSATSSSRDRADRAAAGRRRQDARRRARRGARGGRLLPLLRGRRRARTLVPERMPGPTGETNELIHRGRGVFVCISPWNFPLAIFTGQVAAALVAGNTRGREAGRADAADRRRRGPADARGRRAGERAASRARRRQGRAPRSPRTRASRASRSPARPKSRG